MSWQVKIGRAALAALLLWASACGPEKVEAPQPPSILLIVVDTLRADAVSAYGEVVGTTPALDRLAREGLLYRNAFAPAPWTLPSHATLFSGLRIDEHGVGVHGNSLLPEEIVTLAERMRAAGYATAGFSENMSVSEGFQFSQGFDTYMTTPADTVNPGEVGPGHRPALDVVAELARWLDEVGAERPAFAFVNLFQAHSPYQIRPSNDFLPEGTNLERARNIKARMKPQRFICGALPTPEELAIVRGFYLGDVAAADARLGGVWQAMRARRPGLITIVVSDHGEHFGEHRLLFHYYSVRDAVLRVPLIVHGLPDVAPAAIEAPVGLIDIAPSILAWSGVEPAPALSGRLLPTLPGPPAAQAPPLLAAYLDPTDVEPGKGEGGRRQFCSQSDRVFGDMLAWIDYPYKLIWFEDGHTELYDLSWDVGETADLSSGRPEQAAALEQALHDYIEAMTRPPEQTPPPLSPENLETLRALGYID